MRRCLGVLVAALVLAGIGSASVVEAQVTPVPSTPTAEVLGDSSDKDPAQDQLRWLIGGLIVLGVASGVGALVFWRRTRPPRRVTRTRVEGVGPAPVPAREVLETFRPDPAGGSPKAAEAKPPPLDAAREIASVAPVTSESLRNMPLWAEPPEAPAGSVSVESHSPYHGDPSR